MIFINFIHPSLLSFPFFKAKVILILTVQVMHYCLKMSCCCFIFATDYS